MVILGVWFQMLFSWEAVPCFYQTKGPSVFPGSQPRAENPSHRLPQVLLSVCIPLCVWGVIAAHCFLFQFCCCTSWVRDREFFLIFLSVLSLSSNTLKSQFYVKLSSLVAEHALEYMSFHRIGLWHWDSLWLSARPWTMLTMPHVARTIYVK